MAEDMIRVPEHPPVQVVFLFKIRPLSAPLALWVNVCEPLTVNVTPAAISITVPPVIVNAD